MSDINGNAKVDIDTKIKEAEENTGTTYLKD